MKRVDDFRKNQPSEVRPEPAGKFTLPLFLLDLTY